MKFDFLKIKEETEQEFRGIAEILFNNFAIQNKESVFRLIEIEFYWNSLSHKDKSTYERKYVDPATGEWFFHYSGVDIALKNEETNGYGGILIRSIYDINSNPKEVFKGPMICAMKLFSGVNAFSYDVFPKILEYKFSREELKQTERIGLGDNAKQNGFDKSRYRFLIRFNDF
jgi:hypothetical protein